jgi:hypothetical protein
MPDQERIKTLEDGRKVKFIYQELPEDGAFITAQLARNEVVYSVVLTKAGTGSVVKMSKAISRASFRRSNDTRRRRPDPTGFSGLRIWLADWKSASHGETESLQNSCSRPRQGCLLESSIRPIRQEESLPRG